MSIFDWLKKAEELDVQKVDPVGQAATDTGMLEQQVIQVLRTIYDPEIPVNIYDLGLIYELNVQESGAVSLRMTLTSAACPVAQTFPDTVECAVNGVPGVTEARVDLVWDPPWTREMMSEAARLELGML